MGYGGPERRVRSLSPWCRVWRGRVFTASDHNKSSSLRRVLTPIEAVKVRAGRAAPSALLLLVAAYYPQCSYETSSPDKTHGSLPAPARRPAPASASGLFHIGMCPIQAANTSSEVNKNGFLYSLLEVVDFDPFPSRH